MQALVMRQVDNPKSASPDFACQPVTVAHQLARVLFDQFLAL
jgi:hypothetical protein